VTTRQECGTRLVERRRNQRGEVTRYVIEVFHHGLNESRTVGDHDCDVAELKATALLAKLQERWARVQMQENARRQKKSGKELAETHTADAIANIEAIKQVLTNGLSHPTKVDWQALGDSRSFVFDEAGKFPLVEFGAGNMPLSAKQFTGPSSPDPMAPKYHPAGTFIDFLWPPRKKKREEEAMAALERDISLWKSATAVAVERQKAANEMFDQANELYAKSKTTFEALKAEANSKIAAFQTSYMAGDEKAVARYFGTLLGASNYPDFVELECSAGFNPDNGMLVIECELPDKDAIPTLQKVTFTASSNETKEKHISESERDRLYDSMLYQVALRTIFECFHGDAANVLKLMVFNGWVNALNPATGQRNHGCILSLQASKAEFEAIDLAKVDPRACFRQLKGVSAARLSGMTPVRPILQLQTDDPRFVTAHAVADQLDSGYNLATMDWEEFEHLVRELFENEFGKNGAEVHVTRASSDGGVDAVVLDPDPIRGGKIVIQAKRYTNTVGLSAVRDLYGTVINEGANRGVLVSTADYGSDSYEFVKGKPITLLNGANLLSLLEKHGHKARIDLREAKIINALNKEPTTRQ